MALPPTTTIPPTFARTPFPPRGIPTNPGDLRTMTAFGNDDIIAQRYPHLTPFLREFLHEAILPMLLSQDMVMEEHEDAFLTSALEGKLSTSDNPTDYLSVLLPSRLAVDISARISPHLQLLEDAIAELKRAPLPTPSPAPPAPAPPAPAPTPKAKPAAPTPRPSQAKGGKAPAQPSPPPLSPFPHSLLAPTRAPEGDGNLAIRHSPAAICSHLNAALGPSSHQVTLSAARWTAKNNLVVVAGPDTSAYHLSNASHFISATLTSFLSQSPDRPLPISARENVRWSRLLINSIPTGVSPSPGAFSSDELHQALATDNPAYRSLRFTQAPSWVRRPDSYQPGSTSLAVFAFEDPDSTVASGLLANRTLYAFGCAGSIKRWKAKPRAKPTSS
ncbi:hypothetical protein EDB83DRAFT_2652276 [Lactarius deliciosus]|nr:hypothetical protein EDB83DRAFT_2652276 [Lactarius deliciosus]